MLCKCIPCKRRVRLGSRIWNQGNVCWYMELAKE
jgi:hypothetical protein